MPEPEETCGNIKSLNAFNIKSLCHTCSNKLMCPYEFASNLIGEMKTPGMRQEHIIIDCHSYKKQKLINTPGGEEIATNFPVIGSLRPRLWEASVEDLCRKCPPEVKNDCVRHQRLDNLTDISVSAGTWIQAQVVCCNQSERLYQISEPRKK